MRNDQDTRAAEKVLLGLAGLLRDSAFLGESGVKDALTRHLQPALAPLGDGVFEGWGSGAADLETLAGRLRQEAANEQ